jgi:hypothetical protein
MEAYRNILPARIAIGMLMVALLGCTEEPLSVRPAPPLVGFGDTLGVLTEGSEIPFPILLTRGPTGPVDVPYSVTADEAQAAAFGLGGDSTVTVAADALQTELVFTTPANLPDEVIGTSITVLLHEAPGIRLSERRRARLFFGFRNEVELERWAPRTGFPRLYGYTSFSEEPVPGEGRGPSAGEHFAFAYASPRTPNTIGFRAPSPEDGTNAFNMVRIYADEDVTAGSAGINLPEVLRFAPAFPGASSGRVTVIPQEVELTRTAASGRPPFTIGIGGEGTYDESTGIISLSVVFDETDIGGPERVVRNYLYESERRN